MIPKKSLYARNDSKQVENIGFVATLEVKKYIY